MTKLVAATGFSANGVAMKAGEELTDQFDPQTVKVLVGMKRLVEVEATPAPVDPAPADDGKSAGKNRAVGLPGGLPGAAT